MKARISVTNLQSFQCTACCAPFASVRVLLMFFTSPVKFVLYKLSLFSTQVSDNAQLSQLHSSSEDTVTMLEEELSRVRGEVVDQQSLMATISQDKESISRAVAQNKDLKEQLAELQEAYVQKSHQNMELASSLDSEKYRGQKLTQQLTEMEEELTEERRRGDCERAGGAKGKRGRTKEGGTKGDSCFYTRSRREW